MPGTKYILWYECDGIQSSSYPFIYAFMYAKYIYLCMDEWMHAWANFIFEAAEPFA